MKKLYIIGNAESEFARPCRVSENSAVKTTERVWATLSAERLGEFKDYFDTEFAGYKTSAGHYNRSPQAVIHSVLSDAWKDVMEGREFAMEVYDLVYRGYTTTFVRRAMPTPPQS